MLTWCLVHIYHRLHGKKTLATSASSATSRYVLDAGTRDDSNFLQLLFFGRGRLVTVSYLLIGFWYTR